MRQMKRPEPIRNFFCPLMHKFGPPSFFQGFLIPRNLVRERKGREGLWPLIRKPIQRQLLLLPLLAPLAIVEEEELGFFPLQNTSKKASYIVKTNGG